MYVESGMRVQSDELRSRVQCYEICMSVWMIVCPCVIGTCLLVSESDDLTVPLPPDHLVLFGHALGLAEVFVHRALAPRASEPYALRLHVQPAWFLGRRHVGLACGFVDEGLQLTLQGPRQVLAREPCRMREPSRGTQEN